MSKLKLFFMVLVITGCASNLVLASEQELAFLEKVAKMEIGKTTYSEVIAELGQPEKMATTPDGINHRFFIVLAGSPNAASYAPVVGLFAGEVNYKGASAYMTFSKENILLSKEIKKY